jgi:hypothetical protein
MSHQYILITLYILIAIIIARYIWQKYIDVNSENFDANVQSENNDSHQHIHKRKNIRTIKPLYNPYLSNDWWYNRYTPFLWNNSEGLYPWYLGGRYSAPYMGYYNYYNDSIRYRDGLNYLDYPYIRYY